MKNKFRFLLLLLLLGLALGPRPGLTAAPELQWIDPAALKGMMGSPDLVVIDVSQGWWTYDKKIAGSLVLPGEVSSWAPRLSKDKKIVVYCG